MRTVFLDTVGLLASWDSTDQWHAVAIRALDDLGSSVRTVSTSFVLLECGNAAARRPYRYLVDEMRKTLEVGKKLILPSRKDWEQAWSDHRRGNAADAGIVDHISFVVMRRLGITDAFNQRPAFQSGRIQHAVLG